MEQHIKTRMKKGKQDTITLVHKSAVGYKSSPAPSPPPKVLDDTISLRAYFA